MGRIKQIYIKRVAEKLVKEYGDEFSTDFDENKKKVSGYTNIESTTIRNKVAGCVTRMTKNKRKKEE